MAVIYHATSKLEDFDTPRTLQDSSRVHDSPFPKWIFNCEKTIILKFIILLNIGIRCFGIYHLNKFCFCQSMRCYDSWSVLLPLFYHKE